MILTALILNQLLMPGYKPVAVFHYTQPQGIVLHVEQPKPVATFKYVQPKGITIHQDPIKGIPLEAAHPTVVKTWSF